MSAASLGDLKGQFERIFHRALNVKDKKSKSKLTGNKKSSYHHQTNSPSQFTFDDSIIKCFSTLSPKCRAEEMEDFIYFILDLYQFHGVPVVISEVDVDQVVVELRGVLEEHAARVKGKGPTGDGDDSHIFLVLDKNLQSIPWESLPVLRGKSVSRIPSMDFLLDRLEFSHWRKWEDGQSQEGRVDQAVVDPRKTYFVLNPSGDLKGTEGRFADWLQRMKSAGWDGVVGRAPSEQQIVDAFTNRDLVM